MHGFFGKKQYTARAPSILTIKSSNDLCLECSTYAIFFSPSLIVSMIALSGKQPVRHAHGGPFYVALELRYQLDAVNEALEQFLPIYPFIDVF